MVFFNYQEIFADMQAARTILLYYVIVYIIIDHY